MTGDAPKAHLVIVDDDTILRPVLAGNLRAEGYLVHDFSSPAAAFEALTDKSGSSDLSNPDLLILD